MRRRAGGSDVGGVARGPSGSSAQIRFLQGGTQLRTTRLFRPMSVHSSVYATTRSRALSVAARPMSDIDARCRLTTAPTTILPAALTVKDAAERQAQLGGLAVALLRQQRLLAVHAPHGHQHGRDGDPARRRREQESSERLGGKVGGDGGVHAREDGEHADGGCRAAAPRW